MSEPTPTPTPTPPPASSETPPADAPLQLPADHPLVKTLAEQKKALKEFKAKAQRLDEIEESQKSEAEKTAERVRLAEERAQALEFRATVAEIASDAGVPAALLAGPEDRTPESVKDYAKALNEWANGVKKQGNKVPREGINPTPGDDPKRSFLRGLTGSD